MLVNQSQLLWIKINAFAFVQFISSVILQKMRARLWSRYYAKTGSNSASGIRHSELDDTWTRSLDHLHEDLFKRLLGHTVLVTRLIYN